LNNDTTFHKIFNESLRSPHARYRRENSFSNMLKFGLFAIVVSMGSPTYSQGHHHGNETYSQGGYRGDHGHGVYPQGGYPYRGYHRNHGYWRGGVWVGGYWGSPWYGPEVIVAEPYGYYPAPAVIPVPVPAPLPVPCSIVQRCYPNGTCTDFEVCG
jgi:hypothetical protein